MVLKFIAISVLLPLIGRCEIDVTPKEVSIAIVEHGPYGPKPTIAIHTHGNWRISANHASWLVPTPAQGTGDAIVTLAVNSDGESLKAGTLKVPLNVVRDNGDTAVVDVSLSIIKRRRDPVFSYIAGPSGCSHPDGYPDDAVCVVVGERSPGKFIPPPAGGSYIDPNFGAKIRILAKPPSLHGYSAPSPLSARNTYALIQIAGFTTIVETATGRVHNKPSIPLEGSMWDPQSEETLYYLAGTQVRKYNIRTKHFTTLVDYSRATAPLTAIKTGARSDTSKDGWIAFYAPNESTVCALDRHSRVGATDVPGAHIDIPQIYLAEGDRLSAAEGTEVVSGER